MRELTPEEIAKKSPIYVTSYVTFFGKPPAPNKISASMGRPDSPAPAPGGDGAQVEGETFCAKVADIQERRNLSRGEAVKAAAAENPASHGRHIDRINAQADGDAFRWSYITGEPKNFSEAVNKMLGAGHDPREAVRLAAARYPELFEQRRRKLAKLLK